MVVSRINNTKLQIWCIHYALYTSVYTLPTYTGGGSMLWSPPSTVHRFNALAKEIPTNIFLGLSMGHRSTISLMKKL